MFPTFGVKPGSVGQAQVTNWNDAWRFQQPDKGHVAFNVQKESGLVVTLSNSPGFPQAGYALVLDKRGSNGYVDYTDHTMSTSYFADAFNLDTPLNSSFGLIRNVELCAQQVHHIDITYDHGIIQAWYDGRRILNYYDSAANPGLSYVGFGTTGLASGPGIISGLTIQ